VHGREGEAEEPNKEEQQLEFSGGWGDVKDSGGAGDVEMVQKPERS
jgi:hypothetical protein